MDASELPTTVDLHARHDELACAPGLYNMYNCKTGEFGSTTLPAKKKDLEVANCAATSKCSGSQTYSSTSEGDPSGCANRKGRLYANCSSWKF